MKTPLKKAREKRAVSAEAVAQAVGVTQAAISRIENGTAQASPKLADRLARYFGPTITRDEILYPEYYDLAGRKPVPTQQTQQDAA